MALPGIVQTQALLSSARAQIDAAEALLIAPGVVAADVAKAQFQVIDAIGALQKALIAVENSEDRADGD